MSSCSAAAGAQKGTASASKYSPPNREPKPSSSSEAKDGSDFDLEGGLSAAGFAGPSISWRADSRRPWANSDGTQTSSTTQASQARMGTPPASGAEGGGDSVAVASWQGEVAGQRTRRGMVAA